MPCKTLVYGRRGTCTVMSNCGKIAGTSKFASQPAYSMPALASCACTSGGVAHAVRSRAERQLSHGFDQELSELPAPLLVAEVADPDQPTAVLARGRG